jgi:hypothetical protein
MHYGTQLTAMVSLDFRRPQTAISHWADKERKGQGKGERQAEGREEQSIRQLF